MKVYKFGGASVKDAEGVKNVASVLRKTGYEDTLVVVSAMGKTTNALEDVIKDYLNKSDKLQSSINVFKNFHLDIISHLFTSKNHNIYEKVLGLFNDLEVFLTTNKSENYSFVYDQVIGFGELLSTTIVSEYLNTEGINNEWLDARYIIKTDNFYRSANVNWDATLANTEKIDRSKLYITQGFLGSDSNNFTTSLGREGSDYSAAIFAYCLQAKEVSIWKDVPGVLNADPRYFNSTKLLTQISYKEAIELAYYGASVIHPKTLQPLKAKLIPLYVKSFLNPTEDGTCVGDSIGISPNIPCFIVKTHQTLIHISSLDFSYILEENISEIFAILHLYKIKVHVIQNSAISFSICIGDLYNNKAQLMEHLKAKFKVSVVDDVKLFTIRHYNDDAIKNIEKDKTVLLKQLSEETVQIVTK